MATSLSPETLAALKARQIAFFSARMTSSEAAEEWVKNATQLYGALLDERVSSLLDPHAVSDAVDALLTIESVEHGARPVAIRLLPIVLKRLMQRQEPLEAWVPERARGELDRVLANRGCVPDRLIRELGAQEVVEEILRDVLFEALKEFTEKVNPFVADWGIPLLLKRIAPFGLGLGKGLESMRADFERRLEPEIRRFLAGFSRRGLARMIEVFLRDAHEPRSVALRLHLGAWILEQEIGELARGADPSLVQLGLDAGLSVTAAALVRDDLRQSRRSLLVELAREAENKTLREVLHELGVTFVPDLAPLARATWPVARAVLAGPLGTAWITSLIDDFFATEGLPPSDR